MYFIEMYQQERRFMLGAFEQVVDATTFLSRVPFIKKQDEMSYTLQIAQVPNYYEVQYNNHIFVFTRFMFSEYDGEAAIYIMPVTNFRECAKQPTFAEADVRVDAYHVAPEEAQQYIAQREALFNEVQAYFQQQGLSVARYGLGSEDGEYAYCEGHLFMHLDGATIDARAQAPNFAQFIEEMTT